ncbi:SpoIIE family protein phosphatase [Dactylosporangium aurantiacum]|uniref:SpoIIE family protein phosphatase n=1 Tax=Dactylosporangium aurantiacum TaxID=35754 RepID=A0A9Q9MG65_9ACTN|nr:SpoIIE family protein phosphatase [Dactylosporangium aurantiacum]MDG6109547.1 SpoIIE family protein phosphatase [Dactylosporangium aurantiacum]UWZ51296.1 SpoIIE family protein phosphatase [Dactylosporangium aurantiacum]
MRPGHRLLLSAVALSLVVATVFGLAIYRQAEDGRAAALDDTADRARVAAIEVFGYRLGIVRTLQALATDTAFRSGSVEAIRARLGGIDADTTGLTGGFAWADATGTVRVATNGPTGQAAESQWQRPAGDGVGWTVTGATRSASFAGEVMIFAVPTVDAYGVVNGVLAAGWSLDFVRAVTAARNAGLGDDLYGSQTKLYLLDRDGRLVAGPGITTTTVVPPAVDKAVTAHGERFGQYAYVAPTGIDGHRRQVVAFARFEPFNEVVILQRPADVTFRATTSSTRRQLIEAAGLLLAVLLGSSWLGHHLDRADAVRRQRTDADHDLALKVQQSLLPRTLAPGAQARYLPASRPIAMGGDWYDARALSPHETLLVIGDVAGHDVNAALHMGRVRTAVEVLAERAAGPADLLRLLSRHYAGDPDTVLVSVFCAVVDTRTAVIRYASAGHPPPLLRHADGSVQRLADKPGPIIGIGLHNHAELEVTAPGSTLVLYTDGLVEVAGEGLDFGVQRLADAVSRMDPRHPGAPDALIDAALGGAEPIDDVALLVFHIDAER